METIQAELRKSMHYLSMKKRDHAADKIDALQAQVEALTAELNNVGLPKLAMCPACMEEVSMLQCDQLTQDAKRYRWLRSQNWHDSDMAVVCYPKVSVKLGAVCPSSELLDEAIDAAIAKGTAND